MSLIIYCFVVTATPGPTNIIILSNVQNFGIKTVMRFTYGSTKGGQLIYKTWKDGMSPIN